MSEFKEGGAPTPQEKEQEPNTKYQLLYDRALKWDDGAIRVAEWTEDELENWEESGYRRDDGHFTEVGLYDSQEELDEAIEELEKEHRAVEPEE